MGLSQSNSKRKASGSRLTDARKKKKFEQGRKPLLPKIDSDKRKSIRVLGGNAKAKLLSAEKINVFDAKNKKTLVAKLKKVVDNPANRNFIRRNILTKGTIVETDKGNARITNRPGQEGTVNGVLI